MYDSKPKDNSHRKLLAVVLGAVATLGFIWFVFAPSASNNVPAVPVVTKVSAIIGR